MSHKGNRQEIIIDIFLPNWRRQTRFVRILGATASSTEAHERVIREGMVGWTHGEHVGERKGKGWLSGLELSQKQTWPQNQHANSPSNYSDCPSRSRVLRRLPWFRATVLHWYIVFSVTVYGVRPGYRLTSFTEAESESEWAESKEPQGVLTVSSGRHLTSLNMDYSGGRDYTAARTRYIGS